MIEKILITLLIVGLVWSVIAGVALVLFVLLRRHVERVALARDHGLGYIACWTDARRDRAERETFNYLGVAPELHNEWWTRHYGRRKVNDGQHG